MRRIGSTSVKSRRRGRYTLRRRKGRRAFRPRVRRVGRRVGGKRRVRRVSSRRRLLKARRGLRRGRRSSSKGTVMHLTAKTAMVPPFSYGLTPADLGTCPDAATLNGSNMAVKAEQVQSGVLCQYSFDFTRMVNMPSFGVGGSHAFPGAFKFCRLGRGSMVIRRIDSGANNGYVADTSVVGSPAVPMVVGTRSTLLRLHYLRLSSLENSTGDWSIATLMADPRCKHRSLRPGRRIRFGFTATACGSRSYTALTRAANPEVDCQRTIEFPGRQTRLGWIPTGSLALLNPSLSNSATAVSGGISPTTLRILSNTLLMLFEWDGVGPFAGGYLSTHTMSYTPATVPLIFRSETLRYSLKGLRTMEMPYAGQIIPVIPFGSVTGVPQTEKIVNYNFVVNNNNLNTDGPDNWALEDGNNAISMLPGPLTYTIGPVPDGSGV